MKVRVRILEGCLVAGRPVGGGTVLDVPAVDAGDLLACGRAVLVNPHDVERIRDANHRIVEQAERRARTWLRR
jgi:hypothetical protein